MNQQALHTERTPLVSVIMPTYNCAKYIAQAIASVQRQTLEDWELLVIDDASEDNTVSIVMDLANTDPRIKLHTNTANAGTAQCRNHAMQISRGQYIAYLDSDDIWYPEKLARQLARMEQTKSDLVYCSYGYIDEDGSTSSKQFSVPEQVSLPQMLQKNVIGCSTVMVTKDIARQYRFSPQYHFEDYVFWLALLMDGKQLVGIRDVLVDYRIRKHSRSNNKLLCATHRWQVYRKFLGFSAAKSLYYLIQYAAAGILKYLSI